MNEHTEDQVMAAVRNGDVSAFNSLFMMFHKPLIHFASSLIEDKQIAEDIVSETFTKFWMIRANFETVTNVKAFLYITCRNNCFNYLKYRQRKAERERELVYLLTTEEEEDAEAIRVHAEVLRVVYEEIEKLPSRCRNVFRMCMEGLKPYEIALKMDITESNVRNQKKRALQLLRTTLLKNKLIAFFVFVFYPSR